MTTAISTFIQTQFYILDSENLPRKATSVEYHNWHHTLPSGIKTTKGVRIASDFDDKTIVSTVFLGEAQGYDNNGDPVLWETFLHCNGSKELYRYSSHDDAMMGHEALCISLVEAY